MSANVCSDKNERNEDLKGMTYELLQVKSPICALIHDLFAADVMKHHMYHFEYLATVKVKPNNGTSIWSCTCLLVLSEIHDKHDVSRLY